MIDNCEKSWDFKSWRCLVLLDPEEIKNAGVGILMLIIIVYVVVEVLKILFR